MHRTSPTLHTGQSCETEKYVMGPTWPKMKCDFAGEGQQQYTRPDQTRPDLAHIDPHCGGSMLPEWYFHTFLMNGRLVLQN